MTHYLIKLGYSYLVKTDLSGYVLWGSRQDAVRFNRWQSRTIAKRLRTGDGTPKLREVKIVRVVVVRL